MQNSSTNPNDDHPGSDVRILPKHPAEITHYSMPCTKGSRNKKRAACGATEGSISGKLALIDCVVCREVVEKRKATLKKNRRAKSRAKRETIKVRYVPRATCMADRRR